MNVTDLNNNTVAGMRDSEPVELDISDLISLRTAPVQSEPAADKQQFHFPGQRPSPRRGQGLEFEDLREYTPGDDLRFIDWNVTARTTRLHTRLYRDERERTTTVIADLRSCMFSGTEALKARRAVTDAARVIWSAVSKGDRCSAIAFDDSSVEASRPIRGEAGAIHACQLLVSRYREKLLEPDAISENSDGLSHLLQLILNAGRLTGYCFVFSSADQLLQLDTDLFQEVSAKGQLTWILILDQAEVTGLPAGNYNYRSSDSVATKSTASITAHLTKDRTELLTDALEKRLKERVSLLKKHSIPVMILDSLEADRYLTANLAAQSLI